MNKENFKKILDHIKAHPETWDQTKRHSDCGKKHSFAGWAELAYVGLELDIAQEYSNSHPFLLLHGALSLPGKALIKYLGLTPLESSILLSPWRTIEDFEKILVEGFWGSDGFNIDGYDKDGFNEFDYDRLGYNRKGFDVNGFNIDGFDVNGFDCDGYNRDGYDRAGFNIDGFDVNGFDRWGYNRDGYDRDGYDRDGYDREGNHKDNYNVTQWL